MKAEYGKYITLAMADTPPPADGKSCRKTTQRFNAVVEDRPANSLSEASKLSGRVAVDRSTIRRMTCELCSL